MYPWDSKATHVNMALSRPRAHGYQHGFWQWHRQHMSTWPSVVTWASDVKTTPGCSRIYDPNMACIHSMDHTHQNGFKWQHRPQTSELTSGFISAWGSRTDHQYHGLWKKYRQGRSFKEVQSRKGTVGPDMTRCNLYPSSSGVILNCDTVLTRSLNPRTPPMISLSQCELLILYSCP